MDRKFAPLFVLFLAATTMFSSIAARSSEIREPYDARVLAQVAAFYGISEEAASIRLDKEYLASVQARRIEELQLPGYAGAWFDPLTLALRVAVSSDESVEIIQNVGAVPVRVATPARTAVPMSCISSRLPQPWRFRGPTADGVEPGSRHGYRPREVAAC
jgi:hypothetical protein